MIEGLRCVDVFCISKTIFYYNQKIICKVATAFSPCFMYFDDDLITSFLRHSANLEPSRGTFSKL